MRRRKFKTLTVGATMICGLALTTAQAQLFHRGEPDPVEPPTLEQIARTLDKIADSIRDDGIVVIKQPDVWGEARKTKYRREFEQMFQTEMLTDTAKFDQGLQAIIARTDQASFVNRTALAGILTKTAPDTLRPGRLQKLNVDASTVPSTLNTMTNNVFGAAGLPSLSGTAAVDTKPFATAFDSAGELLAATKSSVGCNQAAAVEPTVKLDELKRYIEAGHRHRQNQQGDDISDSASYCLYIIRMPVSIQPGETTLKGHGAMVTATMYHDFAQDYLGATFCNLLINDLDDQLTPAVYQIHREETPGRIIELEGKIASTQAELDRISEEKEQLIITVTERILSDLQASILNKKKSIE